MAKKSFMTAVRHWSRPIHRDLSYFFTGMLLIYAVSGFLLNHKRDFNSDFAITRTELTLDPGALQAPQQWTPERAKALLEEIGAGGAYLKHYLPQPGQLKVFIRGGSTLTVELATGQAVHESIRKRPLWSALNRLHYNPSQRWTLFSDLFLGALLVIVISGLVMTPGRKGLWGRGGVELAAGILIPLLFIFFL